MTTAVSSGPHPFVREDGTTGWRYLSVPKETDPLGQGIRALCVQAGITIDDFTEDELLAILNEAITAAITHKSDPFLTMQPGPTILAARIHERAQELVVRHGY